MRGCTEIISDVNGIRSRILRDGYAYWLEKKGNRLMPTREDIDPVIDRPKLCSNVLLMDVLRDPLDLRYRLIGSGIRQRMSKNWLGTLMSEIDFQRAPNPMWEHHTWVVENKALRFIRPEYVHHKDDFSFVESAIFPLGHDQVDMLLSFVDFVRPAE